MSKDATKSNNEKKHFWKDFKAELKKVIWPTPKQVVNNTVAVMTIVIITAAIVFALDLAFEAGNTYGINKLKSIVSSNKAEDNANNTENTTTDTTENDATVNTVENNSSEEQTNTNNTDEE